MPVTCRACYMRACCCLHRAQLFVTPWTTAYRVPLSMGFCSWMHCTHSDVLTSWVWNGVQGFVLLPRTVLWETLLRSACFPCSQQRDVNPDPNVLAELQHFIYFSLSHQTNLRLFSMDCLWVVMPGHTYAVASSEDIKDIPLKLFFALLNVSWKLSVHLKQCLTAFHLKYIVTFVRNWPA